jgi:acyl carrier protein
MNNLTSPSAVPDILSRLRPMLACRLGRDDHEIEDHLDLVNELYVDSLDLVEIEIGVAETFGISLTEQDMLSMGTVGDLGRIISDKLTPFAGHAG